MRHEMERIDEVPLQIPDLQSARTESTVITNHPTILAIKAESPEEKGILK